MNRHALLFIVILHVEIRLCPRATLNHVPCAKLRHQILRYCKINIRFPSCPEFFAGTTQVIRFLGYFDDTARSGYSETIQTLQWTLTINIRDCAPLKRENVMTKTEPSLSSIAVDPAQIASILLAVRGQKSKKDLRRIAVSPYAVITAGDRT